MSSLNMNRYLLASFIAGLLIISQNNAHAEWDTAYLMNLGLISSTHAASLQEGAYNELKAHVLNELANSWCSQEKAVLIMDLMMLERPRVCVEIGVFNGASLLPAAATLKYLAQGDIYAIDPWSNQEATKNMDAADPNKFWWDQVDLESVYHSCHAMLSKWNLQFQCHVMPCTSEAAAKYLNRIDFLHMDGDYSTKGSLLDVQLYLPKVKKGGYILFSNLFLSVDNKQPKMKAFSQLLDSCEIICEVDHNNSALLRKIVD